MNIPNNHAKQAKFVIKLDKKYNIYMNDYLFFKITNQLENINGFQYTDGLNVLDKPFDEHDSWVANGFYFTDVEHIGDFINSGCYLREVRLPVNHDDFQMVCYGNDRFITNKIILGERYDLSDPATYEFLTKAGAKIGPNVLHWACGNNYINVVKYLVANGLFVRSDSFKLAAARNHLDMVKYLLTIENININDLRIEDAIYAAIRANHLDMVKFLIQVDADRVNPQVKLERCVENCVLAGIADIADTVDMLKYLLSVRNNIDITRSLEHASEKGFFEMVKILVQYEQDNVNHICKLSIDKSRFGVRGNNIALTNAALMGHLDIVKYLIEHGANIHAHNDRAIQLASNYGKLDVVKYLVEHGANVCVNDNYAVKWAAHSGHLSVVQYLVEHGADIHANQNYAIRFAAKHGDINMVKYLVSVQSKIPAGYNYAAKMAKKHGHSEVLEYLISVGAQL